MTPFKPCLLIPHFCHVAQLSRFLPSLADKGLPIVVVDDGSPLETQDRLQALCAPFECVTVVLRAANGGKGAATVSGLQWADQHAYTHVVSMDADGQHDPADLPDMLETARRHPEHIVSARPLFGDDIPSARLHGRKITNTLVRIEAADWRLLDAMCGFRIYPVAMTLALCRELGWRTYMEFDVEILVRAAWRGMEVHYVPSKVVYPEDGASHFRMFKDNTRLTVMHITLLLGALARSPVLLWRSLRR